MNTPFVFAIYLACLAVACYTQQASLALLSFDERMIGVATLNGISIPQRVGLFTNGMLYFILVFAAVFLIANLALVKRWISDDLIRNLNYLAFAGLGLLFFYVFGMGIAEPTGLLFCIILLLLVQEKLEQLVANPLWQHEHRWPLVTIATLLGLSVYALFKETVINYLELSGGLPVYAFVFLFGGVFLGLFRRYATNSRIAHRMLVTLLPVLFLPVLSVFSDELYLVLSNRSIFLITPKFIYLSGLLLLLLAALLCFIGAKQRSTPFSLQNLLTRRFIPFFLLSIGFFTFHNAFLHLRPEFFEVGNPALGIQRWYLFKEIPLFESFNSHLLAELVYGFLYTTVNGFNGLDYNLYYFLNRVVYSLLTYYFIYRFWKNPYVALGMALLMAFYTTWLPRSFFMALLMPFALEKVTKEGSGRRSDFIFFLTLTLLIVWRIDIGFANLLAAFGTLFFVYLFSPVRLNWMRLFKNCLVLSLVSAALIFGFSYIMGIPLLTNAEQALHYLSSTQTYGYLDIFPDGLEKGEWHYYVFPVIVVIFLLYMFLYGLREAIQRQEHFAGISIIYLGIFYLANFQRGIVRHGLVEGTDEIHTSFGFFILSVIPFFTLGNRPTRIRIISSVVLSLVLISGFKYNGVAGSSNWYNQFTEKLTAYRHITPQDTVIDRVVRPPSYHESQFAALKQLMKNQLDEHATFLDFSNTPILYFLLDKRVPSYFNQNILSVHDDFLQEKAVEQLSNEDIPFVVFSHYPQTWHDEVDGVPNSLRHYKIAEFIFGHYAPYAVINNFCVWKRKDVIAPPVHSQRLVVDSTGLTMENELVTKGSVVALVDDEQNSTLIENLKQVATTPIIQTGTKTVFCFNSIEELEKLEKTAETEHSFQIHPATYFPDVYSGRVRHFDLKQLPGIWQRYDPVGSEKETLALLATEMKNDTVFACIPSGLDKSTGNYLLVSFEPGHELMGRATLTYGINNQPQGYFYFDVQPDQHEYLIRLSTQYRWTAEENDYFRLVLSTTPNLGNKAITLNLLKGN